MKWNVVIVPFIPAQGMALYPFILLKDKAFARDEVLLRHERIHLRQQAEMLVIPFYMAYLLHYVYNRCRGMGHYAAYRAIIFEQEAYLCERNIPYLQQRKFWQFLKYRQ